MRPTYSPTKTPTAVYAAYDEPGHIIWGIGSSRRAARADALKSMRDYDTRLRLRFITAPISYEYYKAIQEKTCDTDLSKWRQVDGVIYSNTEIAQQYRIANYNKVLKSGKQYSPAFEELNISDKLSIIYRLLTTNLK